MGFLALISGLRSELVHTSSCGVPGGSHTVLDDSLLVITCRYTSTSPPLRYGPARAELSAEMTGPAGGAAHLCTSVFELRANVIEIYIFQFGQL
jgi:hypothetical protein